MNLHAEMLALQRTLGLSYKDAVHRLYMAEGEKLKVEKDSLACFSKVQTTNNNTIINKIYPPITEINTEVFHENPILSKEVGK